MINIANELGNAFCADLACKPFVVAAIPAYNEEKMIAQVVSQAYKYVDMVIVCDDGSIDRTAELARQMGADVVVHKKNAGYGAAIHSLFNRAKELSADVMVTLDADGQHDPQEIPLLVNPILQNQADIIIGSRFQDSKGTSEMRLYRQVGAKIITKLVNASLTNNVSDSQSGLRAYNRKAITELNVADGGMGASVEILMDASKHALKISEVPATCKYHIDGIETSTKNPLTHGVSVVFSVFRFALKSKIQLIYRSGTCFRSRHLTFGQHSNSGKKQLVNPL